MHATTAHGVQASVMMNGERLAREDVVVSTTLASFIGHFRNEIVDEWQREVRRLPVSEGIEPVRLVDAVPDLVEQLGEMAAEIVSTGQTMSRCETAYRHAVERLDLGFDLSELVSELSLLRASMLDVWMREHGGAYPEIARALNLAVDRAITVAIQRFTENRDRTLAAIDRISTAAFEAQNIEELLQRLLHEFMHATPAVDTAAIMLREGDRLYTRAAVGIEEEVQQNYSVAIGEGFCGMIAATGSSIHLRSAYLDPMVPSEALRRRRVLALSGVPLIQNDQVIGVAHMGSVTAHEFAHEDRQLFASMAARATAGINQHLLRTELTRSEDRYKRIAAEREIALAKLEGLLAASPVGIGFLDQELRYIRINEALARMNGASVPEHLGRTVREVLPEVAPLMEPLLRQILATGKPLLDLHFNTPPDVDGRKRTFLGSYFPVRSPGGIVFGVGAVVTDITDLKRAQDELERSRRMLRSVIEHAPAAIFVKDERGRIVLANQGISEILGRPLDEIIGAYDHEIVPEAAASVFAATDQRVIDGDRMLDVEEVVPMREGVRTYLSSKFPVPGPDGRRWLCGISKDITDLKRIENELRDAVRAREDLIAVVSHDLRNPLGTITLGSTLMQTDETLQPRARKQLDMIQRSAHRMARLIDDLLDMATIQLGRLSLRIEAVDAAVLVRDAIEVHQPLAHEKGIMLAGRAEGLVGLKLVCDPERIQRVFANLIGNALKFCGQGDTIRVEGARGTDHVTYSIQDSGPGIDPEVLPYLFDPYWSAPEHARRGVGLGLFISKGIIAAHGGTIWVESQLGAGARFLFTLPAPR